MFGTRLQLKHVTNTVTLDQPQWGQLGCNGFIILDENGDVKLKKTLAFLQFRERAFQQVLELMNAMLSKSDTAFSAALKTKNYVMTGSGDTCDPRKKLRLQSVQTTTKMELVTIAVVASVVMAKAINKVFNL